MTVSAMPKLQRHLELISRIGDAMSRGVIESWSRDPSPKGWRWTIETPEGPCCLTFKRGVFSTKEAEDVVRRLIDCHRERGSNGTS